MSSNAMKKTQTPMTHFVLDLLIRSLAVFFSLHVSLIRRVNNALSEKRKDPQPKIEAQEEPLPHPNGDCCNGRCEIEHGFHRERKPKEGD
jgi:hypothetical protein